MSNEHGHFDKSEALRRMAEDRLSERSIRAGVDPNDERNEADIRRLQHELEVHQIELEMQNEALQQALADTEEAMGRCVDLFDFAPTGYFNLAPDGAILAVNLAGARLAGIERAELCKRRIASLVCPSDLLAFNAFLAGAFKGGGKKTCEVRLLRGPAGQVYVQFEAIVSADGKEVRATVLDITERRAAEAERAQMFAELEHALAYVKLLSGMLPICASCKKIRDVEGNWSEIDQYVSENSEVTFSHGICPDCFALATEDYEDESK